MANTTLSEMPPPTAPPARKNGRATKPEASEAPQKTSGVPVIGDASARSNAEWLDSTTEDDWAHMIAYVWRCEPVTDRKSGGGPTSIDKITRKFDYADIRKMHGSGRYRFDISYIPPNGGKQTRIKQFYETIFSMEHPPMLPMGDWVDDPRNKDWAWAKPALEAAERERVLKAAAAFNGAPPAEPQSKTEELSELLELAEKLRGKDGNAALLVELIKMNDPTKVLTLAKEIAAVQQPAPPREDAGTALLMKFLIEELRDSRQRNLNAPDPLETTTKLITGAKELFSNLGMGAAPAAAGKVDTASVVVSTAGDIIGRVVDRLGEYAPSIIGLVQHLKDRDLQIAQIRAQQGMNTERPWEFQNRNPPPARTVQPPAPPPAAPNNAPAPAPVAMTPQLLFQKYQAMLQSHFSILVDKFQNEDGFAMQDHLLDREGRRMFNQFRADATVDLLLGLVAANEQLKAIFTPQEKARQFFEELLSEPEPAGQTPEEDPPAEEED